MGYLFNFTDVQLFNGNNNNRVFVLIDHGSNEAKRSRDHFVTKGLRNTSFQNYAVEVVDDDLEFLILASDGVWKQDVGGNHAQSVGFSTDGFANTFAMRKMDLLLQLLETTRAALQLEISCLYSEGGNVANDVHIQRNDLPYDLRRGYGYALFVAVYAGLEVLAIPAIPLTLSTGLLFGSLTGTILASISGTVAASVAFLIARYFARDMK
ncbi:TVP38/TMEM64 family membrane protein slr0305 [Tanacetum coccineum]